MQDASGALVSVIVPIYNASQFLKQCLDSICMQTHRNLEILCINDGSTDNSLDILRSCAQRDARIRIIDKENGGYGAGCNRGIAEAKGEWVSIIEPDDWIDSGMYGDMLAFAAQFQQSIDIIKTPWWDVMNWNDSQLMEEHPCPLVCHMKRSAHSFTLADNPQLLEFHPGIWSALYRKEFLVGNNIKFPEYPGAGWADNPFLADVLARAKAIVYYDRAYYHYRSDLPGSTLNHATEDAVRRPFDRWMTMLEILEAANATNEKVLESLYMRGFTYVEGAMYDDGVDNPIVQEGARRIFGVMDKEIVLNSSKLSGRRKREFCRVLGLKPGFYASFGRVAYLVRDACNFVRVYGLAAFLERFGVRWSGRKRDAEVKRDFA